MSLWGSQGGTAFVGNTFANTTLGAISSTATLKVGMSVTGNNVGVGNTVVAILNSTAVTLSSIPAGASNGTYTFAQPPKWKHAVSQQSKANGAASYGNVIVGAMGKNEAAGMFPANTLQVHQSNGGGAVAGPSGGDRITAPGWLRVTQGTGPLKSVVVGNATVIGFANLGTGQVKNAASNSVLATFHITSTNATGGTLAFAIDNQGAQFLNAAAVQIVSPSNSIVLANISTPGVGYSNVDAFTFSNGVVNGASTPTTNSMGAITALTINLGGAGFTGTAGQVQVNYVAANVGSISSAIVVAGTSLGFTNGDIATFSGNTTFNTLAVNATASLTTNATGGITAAAIVTCGKGFDGNASHVTTTFSNSTGGVTVGVIGTGSVKANTFNGLNGVIVANTTSFGGTAAGNANFSAVLGGRAGRINYETLAEISSISSGAGPAFPYS